jgi:hypothetical protein
VLGQVLVGGLITGACWLIGLDLATSITLALLAVTLFGLRALVPGEPESWPPEPESAHNTGARREVARLSWGLHGHDDRVDRWSARRLHALAAQRMAERDLDLDADSDEAECRRLLGSAVYDALSLDPNQLPRYASFVAALDAVERLAPEGGPR